MEAKENICNNCGKEISIKYYVFSNAETYGRLVIGKSECCGIGYIVKPKTVFQVTRYTGERKEDDWGKPIKTPI